MDKELVALRRPITATRSKWMSIANDLALSQLPGGGTKLDVETICLHYGLTDSEAVELFQLPEFKNLVREAIVQLKQLGPNASMIQHCRLIAADMQEKIYQQMLQSAETKDMIKFYELLMKYSLMDPSTNGVAKGDKPQTSVQVNLNLHSEVRGLEPYKPTVVDGEIHERSIPVFAD